MNPNRETPFDSSAEAGVLSCFLQRPELLTEFEVKHPPEFFYHPAHVVLFHELRAMRDVGKPIDLVTISNHLFDAGLMDKIGGPGMIADLYSFVPTPAHFGYYCDILRDKHILRTSIQSCEEVLTKCYEGQEDISLVGHYATQKMASIASSMADRVKQTDFGDQVMEALDSFEACMTGNAPSSLLTEWRDWNNMIGGISPVYHVIKGRRGLGKSTILQNLRHLIVFKYKKPFILHTFEMGAKQIIQRDIAQLSGVDFKHIKRPDQYPPNREQGKKISEAFMTLREHRHLIYVETSSSVHIGDIKAHAMKIYAKHGELGGLGIDYIQQVSRAPWLDKKASFELQVQETSRGLANLIDSVHAPVFALSHPNKDGTSRHSEGIENDAAVMVALEETEKGSGEVGGMRLEKQRDGESGELIRVKLVPGVYQFKDNSSIF